MRIEGKVNQKVTLSNKKSPNREDSEVAYESDILSEKKRVKDHKSEIK